MANPKSKPRTVGRIIGNARERNGHSYKAAGNVLGVSDKMVKMWEADFTIPDWDKADAIADYCEVSRAEVYRLLGILTAAEAAHLEELDMGGYLAAAA